MSTYIGGKTFKGTREFNAPVKLVWKAFTSPDHVGLWWGPDGFTNTIHKMEVKTGGVWEFIMHGPDGTDYKNNYVYEEVIELKKLVMAHLTGPKFVTTVNFFAEGEKTKIEFIMEFETADALKRAIEVFKADEGFKQNMAKLERYVLKMA